MKNLTFLIWCLLVCLALLLFSCQEQELLSKPYPDTRQEVTYIGTIFSKPIKSIEYKGGYYRMFPNYSPLIHKRPKLWGKIKKY